MAVRSHRVPTYRLHRPSGQAVVTLSGRDFYLGPHGTKASRAAYDRLVGEWQTNGRRLTVEGGAVGPTMAEVIIAYFRFAEGYYRKRGKPTSQLDLIKRALREVRQLYGKEPADAFGPAAFKAVRQRFIEAGLSRASCNEHARRIRRMIAWGVEEQMIPPSVHHALLAVKSLPKGRCEAHDYPPVGPVPAEHVEAVLNVVRPAIAAMIRLQDLAGMRPDEVCSMRAEDLDRSGPVWTYTPETHKNAHRGKTRSICLGPRAQEVLAPWIERHPEGYLFRPRPLPPTPGRSRTRQGKWAPGPRYTGRSYGAIIRRGCDRAGVPRFAPNQLRHGAGTRIRKAFGLEAAQVVLGHARADVTQIYAERDLAGAREVMGKVG